MILKVVPGQTPDGDIPVGRVMFKDDGTLEYTTRAAWSFMWAKVNVVYKGAPVDWLWDDYSHWTNGYLRTQPVDSRG